MRSGFYCEDGVLAKHRPQADDPDLVTYHGTCPDCLGRGCEPPKAHIVSRMGDNDKAILVSFTKPLTDDELRDFHDYVKEWGF